MKRDERFDLNIASEYYNSGLNISDSARKHCEELGIEYGEMYRNALSRHLRKGTPASKEEFEGLSFSAVDNDGKMMDIKTYCDFYGLDFSKVKSYKSVTHSGIPYYNIVFNNVGLISENSDLDNDFISEIVSKFIKPVTVHKVENTGKKLWSDRLIITDVHVGMSTKGGRNTMPLYDLDWGKAELFRRLKQTVDFVIQSQRGSTLYIDELGDFCDGLLGQTTRGGHSLPQNMTDKEAFEIGVGFKVLLVESLLPFYNKIICRNVTNDNHSFLFGYFVNSTVKKILEAKYDSVEYLILERFMEHYSIGNNTFILTHGKDNESLKFAFKPFLDQKQAEKIDQYCKEHNLYRGGRIELSKGDSHQAIFDYTTSNDFDYMNYPAFSPPSNWVTTNFKKTRSGIVVQNINEKGNEKIMNLKWFEQ